MCFRALSIAVLVAAALLAPPGVGALPNTPIKTALTIPIGGVLYHPGTNEHVAITGALAVKTLVKCIPGNPCVPNTPVKITNGYKLAKGTTATGLTSGTSYTLKGANTLKYFWPNDPAHPGNPCRSLTQSAVLHMQPNTPIAPPNPIMGFRVRYQINFDDNGIATTSGAIVEPPTSAACETVATTCNQEQPAPTQSLCANGVTDQDETDVDCGGATCSLRCPIDATCASGTDCHSQSCVGGVCTCVGAGGACTYGSDCCSPTVCGSANVCIDPGG